MKITSLILIVAASLLTLGQAHADTKAVDGNAISNLDDCTLLTANVKVRLSAGVHAAYNCDDTTNRMLYFGTCHVSGSQADRSYMCTSADLADNTATPPKPAVNGCTTAGTAVTLTGRAAYMGTSDGGVISGQNLEATACDDTSITARVTTAAK